MKRGGLCFDGSMMKTYLAAAFTLSVLAVPAHGELIPASKPVSSSPGQRVYVFKTTPQGELKAEVYLPEGWQPGQKRPAIVMFFGGGFTGGNTEQFRTKAEYLASRGMVAITPEYRVETRPKTTPDKSIEDAKSAIRWVRMNAGALGIDPARVVGSGGSAGGTCAALAAWSSAFEPAGEDAAVSAKPDVLVLYNPALAVPGGAPSEIASSLLTSWKLVKGGPPLIQFFGTEDKWLVGGREVARQSAKLGNRSELYTAQGLKHGFFNDARQAKNGTPGWHDVVLLRTDLFLTSLGYLSGKPTVKPDPSLALTKEPL